jgi:transposase
VSARANGSTPADDPQRIIDEQHREIARLRHENERLERERDRLRRENERLKTELETARAAAKRQAAPFSKGAPGPTPKRPGRKAGRRYGRRATRPRPPRIDETIVVPAPATCPHCSGVVEPTHTASQVQIDVPVVRPIVREFQIGIGCCRQCGRRVQGRHPLQTSDALGAAAHQIGPQAVALAATLHTVLGVPYAKIARFFTTAFGLTISRSTLCRALTRLATRAGPTYTALTAQVRESPCVSLDETGWKVAAHLEWLWVAVTPETTVYRIQPGRGFDQAAALIGADYAGVIVRDGWAPYRQFTAADHQSCLAHLLRRCHALIEILAPRTARWPRAVADVLQTALAVRDRHRAGTVSTHGLAIATGRLLAQLVRLLDAPRQHPALRRLARHLDTELTALFTFLVVVGTDATTWRAEQAIRPAVILRKVCGGNRSPRGARTHEILATVLQTAHQRHLDPHPILTQLLHAPAPLPAPDLCTSRPLVL